ncbi:hypothetical protein Cfor_07574 [Coptotermes formosanus]|uniref:Uncharacterized protein n=1 Tax=Coptotermes formosanus TaxID=36987 RepID=A0A6L2Q5R8_COPFO|nr:hypothetical protein Cfor_07574 [Coptotermes formosanus]
MPERKAPQTLRNLSISKVTAMVRGVVPGWSRRLFLSASRGLQYYQQQAQKVTKESNTVTEFLRSLPTHIFDDVTPRLIRKFVDDTAGRYESYRASVRNSWNAEDMYDDACIKMFRGVLVPPTKMYDTRDESSGFAQKLIIQTLNATRNLTHLAFDTAHSAPLASNIHHLQQLLCFQYKHHCADKVVRQLALHCSKLIKIDVSESPAVTDDSVDHLLKLKNLTDVDVTLTSISPEIYALFISELPHIWNISWIVQSSYILDYIHKENLPTVADFCGTMQGGNALAHKCPNIKFLEPHSASEDLSSLATLNNLVELTVRKGDYGPSRMGTELEGVGHRLKVLALNDVENVNMGAIITLHSSLESLQLARCTFLRTARPAVLSPDLPQVKSLIKSAICHT